jgi:hypothetical protein
MLKSSTYCAKQRHEFRHGDYLFAILSPDCRMSSAQTFRAQTFRWYLDFKLLGALLWRRTAVRQHRRHQTGTLPTFLSPLPPVLELLPAVSPRNSRLHTACQNPFAPLLSGNVVEETFCVAGSGSLRRESRVRGHPPAQGQ